jgi:queuine tRNA-ribosyltransferase
VTFVYRQHAVGRTGTITTPHGVLHTPAFVFCGTKGAVKGLSTATLQSLGTQIILANTYHLMVYPGGKHVQERGQLHRWMAFPGPIMTDSGGFQVFSLGHGAVADELKGRRSGRRTLLAVSEEGATFRCYRTGQHHFLTPEKAIETQLQLGADIILVLDECTPFLIPKVATEQAMLRSHRWAMRSLHHYQQNGSQQLLYGIVQGGVFADLRQQSATWVSEQPFFGHAIGGSLGENHEQMMTTLSYTTPFLRPDRPVHLLGIGGIRNILDAVKHSIDTFDCVHPTRLARHGGALVTRVNRLDAREHLVLTQARFAHDDQPIGLDCTCWVCQHHSRAYLHYLFKAKEALGWWLTTCHNVHFMNQFFADIRHHLQNNTYDTLCQQYE